MMLPGVPVWVLGPTVATRLFDNCDDDDDDDVCYNTICLKETRRYNNTLLQQLIKK